jgi:hypothetical protein
MLKKDVVESVKESKFFIYPIERVEEGLEIMTGMQAGELKDDGTYPEGTLNYLIVKRLTEISEAIKDKKKKKEKKEKKEKDKEEEKEDT